MANVERILLYVVAIAFGASLLFQAMQPAGQGERPADSDPKSIRIAARPDYNAASADQNAFALSTAHAAEPGAGESAGRPAGEAAQDTSKLELTRRSLVIVDDAGQPKIELSVDKDGRPRILLNDKLGQPAISLTAGETSEVVVRKGPGRIVLKTEGKGNTSVELTSEEGPRAHMLVSPRGETEIAVSSRSAKSEALVRIDRRGAAEIAIRGEDGQSGPAMTMFPSGDCGIALNRPDGAPGPVMKLFSDQVAEIAIHDAESKSGPSMLRTPDGVSAISLRRESGHPATSMVSAPDGSALITATSRDGKQQASLSVDADGNAVITMPEPKAGQQQPQPAEPSDKSVL